MDSIHGKCSLYLSPDLANFNVTKLSTLVNALQKIHLISHEIDLQGIFQQEQNTHYYAGDKFLDYIAYLGCAPSIQFEASPNSIDNNSDFCFIKIHRYKSARLIHSQKQSRAPICPNCLKPVKDWQNRKNDSTISCNLCNTTSNIENFNWRKMAGYAQLFIEITDIFPKEAIPQQLLLDKLSNISKTEWLYFYSCK
jgi:hypothetical protein